MQNWHKKVQKDYDRLNILSKTKRRYSTYDREFLAVVMATRHFRHHLLGTKFLLRTDLFPLQYLSTATDPWGRRARWITELQEYCFTTECIKGDQNRVADALSRLGFGNDEEQFTQKDNITSPTSLFSPQGSSPKSCMLSDCWTTNTFKDFQKRDLALSAASSHVSGDTSKQLSLDHPEQLQLQHLLREKLTLSKDGVLHRTSSQGHSQNVIPIALIPEVLRLAHDNAFSGHQGVKKTLTRILD